MTKEELKRRRERAGMTQGELAKRLGVHRVTMTRYETGAKKIPKAIALAVEHITDGA